MKYLHIPAPAKINLILKIIQKRSDGYHDLCSLFHRISLSDELLLREKRTSGLKLVVSDKKLPRGYKNVIGKAYRALSDYIESDPGLDVRLQKKIPVGSGLGGGSSDAGSFLMGANELLKLRLSKTELCRLAEKVGSDVPFFIRDTAFCQVEGRGEKLRSFPTKTNYFFVIVAFRKGFSTKEMYESLGHNYQQPVSLTMVRAGVRICSQSLNKGDLDKARKYFENDFLAIACEKLHRICEVIDNWRKRNIPCLMSGSGSSVFAVFDNKKEALREAELMRRQRDLRVFVAESFSQSVHAMIKKELLQ